MICLRQRTSELETQQHHRWLTSGGCVSHFVRETGRQLLGAHLCYVNTIYIPCTLRAVWPSATHAAWAAALQSASQMETGPAPCALPPSYTLGHAEISPILHTRAHRDLTHLTHSGMQRSQNGVSEPCVSPSILSQQQQNNTIF